MSLYGIYPAGAPRSGFGRLRVGTFAVDIGMPLPNANIRLTPHNHPEMTLDVLHSDISGQSEEIELPAPPAEYSFDPEAPKPYSEYDLYISKNGFNTVTVRGVQIYSGTTALQDVRLHPWNQPTLTLDTIIIQPVTLIGDFPPKIPEDEVKELPPATGFVVLPEVVIPSVVIVHGGVPTNASAPTFWVPFTEYIKNVTSSEIFATWPVETIKANVLAIISFTLNRVFTEWYRNKGFSFMITNSTQFDQAFIYGRNIFTEISVVVDEIFANYITRPNIRQPLLTQYCDGRRSQCPNWMRQWESMYLGEQGMLHLNILRHFYGSDIFLAQAPKVEGVPISFPNVVQQVGSTGVHVRRIQEQLNRISDNFPAIPKVRVDGVFSEETRASVQEFQRIFNMPQHGVVDWATWYRMSGIYVAVTRMAELV